MSKDNLSEIFKAFMPFIVTSMMTEIFKKLEWQWKLADQMNAVFLMAMLPVADGVIRALAGPGLEKGGLSPLTDHNWLETCRETEREANYVPWLDVFNRMCLEAVEREIIRRFVWEGE